MVSGASTNDSVVAKMVNQPNSIKLICAPGKIDNVVMVWIANRPILASRVFWRDGIAANVVLV